MRESNKLTRQFEKAIGEFNTRKFYACHDTLEEIWMDTRGKDRFFYQGILHIAVGFFHFLNVNPKGAKSQLTKAKDKLESFRPSYRGVQLESLLESVDAYLLSISNYNELRHQQSFWEFPQIDYHPSKP